MEILVQTVGWIGTILIILAYFLISRQYVTSASKTYQLLNLFGSLGLSVNVFHQQAWPALVLQIIWIAITMASLTRPK